MCDIDWYCTEYRIREHNVCSLKWATFAIYLLRNMCSNNVRMVRYVGVRIMLN